MFANMQDEGCPGQWLDTLGSTVNGSNEIAVPNTSGWKMGSGVAVYDRTTQKGFKGRVADLKGASLVLDTAATFTSMNAVVSSDDSVVYAAVYAKAKAAGGGTIFWPAGIYRVGAKDVALPEQAFRNTPLFISSRIRNIGEGAGNTILKLADEVNMLWPGNPARPLTVCEFWTCGPVFMNEGNRWWFNPHGVSKQNPPYDTQVEISGMTIDCNKDNQSRVYKPFFSGPSAMQADNIHQEYPDSMHWAGVNLGGGMLDPNGFYNPFFRFLDAGGAEGPPNQYRNQKLDTGAPGSNALRLFLPPPTVWPPAAVAIVVYIGRFDDPEHPQDSPTNEFDPCGNPRYEMLAPILLSDIQAWDGNPAIDHWPHVDILSHTHFPQGPVETQGNYRIPGRITSPGDASASSSMSLDQIHGLWVHDIESRNVPIDGILLGDLQDAVFERVRMQTSGRWGLGVASNIFRSVSFTDCVFENNESGGCDLEPAACDGLTFTRCTFRDNNSLGLSMGLVGTIPGIGISFSDCMFENNGAQNLANQGVSIDLVHLLIKHCTFRSINNINLHLFTATTNKIDATIEDCVFDQACGHDPTTPPYAISGRDISQITLMGPNTRVRVINCDFLPFSDGTHHSSIPGVDLGDTPGGHIFIGNRYQPNPLDTRPPAALGERWSRSIKNQSLVSALNPVQLRSCKFIGNSGDANLLCNDDNVALDLLESATGVAVGATATTLAVAFARGMPDTAYQPKVTFGWESGACWITGKTKIGFTINWEEPPGGGGSTLDWSV